MKRAFSLMLLLCTYNICAAQNNLTAVIKDADSKQPLAGSTAQIMKTSIGAATNENLSTYSEISFNRNHDKSDWVTDFNVCTDQFKEFPKDGFVKRD